MRDAAAITGLLLLGAGCSWAWLPLGLIVVGGALLGAAVLSELRDGATRPQKDESNGASQQSTRPAP